MQWIRIDAWVGRRDGVHLSARLLRGVFGAKLAEDRSPASQEMYALCFEGNAPKPYRIIASSLPGKSPSLGLVLFGEIATQHKILAATKLGLALQDLGWSVYRAQYEECKLGDAAEFPKRSTVRIRLTAPLILKTGGRVVSDPERLDFRTFAWFLFSRIREVDKLAPSERSGEWDRIDLDAIQPRLVARALAFKERESISARQRDTYPSSGLLGTIAWSGIPAAIMPYLRAGIDLGLGNGCAYGRGAYELEHAPEGVSIA